MKRTKQKKYLVNYQNLIKEAAAKRKENISAKEIAEKMETTPSVIYRMERGESMVSLRTLLSYLSEFGYKLMIVPDKLEIVPNEPRISKLPKLDIIEFNKEKSLRRRRIIMLRYLLAIEEAGLDDDDNKEE
jgi:transcriptional regulator with XRE-family HTH domain